MAKTMKEKYVFEKINQETNEVEAMLTLWAADKTEAITKFANIIKIGGNYWKRKENDDKN
jgi:hypothetical protein